MTPPNPVECNFPGCRSAAMSQIYNLFYCSRHFNNATRLQCLTRGCTHYIPEEIRPKLKEV